MENNKGTKHKIKKDRKSQNVPINTNILAFAVICPFSIGTFSASQQLHNHTSCFCGCKVSFDIPGDMFGLHVFISNSE